MAVFLYQHFLYFYRLIEFFLHHLFLVNKFNFLIFVRKHCFCLRNFYTLGHQFLWLVLLPMV